MLHLRRLSAKRSFAGFPEKIGGKYKVGVIDSDPIIHDGFSPFSKF